MILKTTDFTFTLKPDDGQCIEVSVKKEIAIPSRHHSPDWEWLESNKRLYLMKDIGFMEGVQKMIKWAYSEAY